MSSFDIVSFPVERQRGRGPLSVIPEGSSVRSGTPSRHSDAPSPARPADSHPPAWVTNPPVDFSKRHDVEQWRRSSSIAVSCPNLMFIRSLRTSCVQATEPNSPDVTDSARDFLGPSSFAPDLQRAEGSTNAQRRTSVQSTEYEIKIEPPVSFMIVSLRFVGLNTLFCSLVLRPSRECLNMSSIRGQGSSVQTRPTTPLYHSPLPHPPSFRPVFMACRQTLSLRTSPVTQSDPQCLLLKTRVPLPAPTKTIARLMFDLTPRPRGPLSFHHR